MTGVLGRKWLAALTLLGLVAALLAVNPDRAFADPGDPDVDNPPTYSACVGPATADAGFEDIAGRTGADAINCLAHYRIALGRTETEFSPTEVITRWQMALFLSRAAGIAGVVLPTAKEDPQFTDIGAISEAAQAAANSLAQLGIMPGTSTTTFSPNQDVTRGSMAAMLDTFLTNATRGEGGADPTKLNPDDDVLTDITTASRTAYIAIRRIYELGITKGVTETLYRPSQPVTREQMALFITRTLAHTIARPAGISIQSDKAAATGSGMDGTEGEEIEVIISVRNEEFQPQVDASMDVFTSTDPDNAFDDDGACDAATTQQGGASKCEIDVNDEQTGVSGDLILALTVAEATTVWAWTGDDGAKYDNDDTTSAMAEIGFNKGATKLLISHDLADDQTKLGFGQTVNITIQVADEENNPVAKEDVTVNINQAVTNAAKAGVNQSSGSSGRNQMTDAEGKIELQFTQSDPTTGNNSDSDGKVVLTITDGDTDDDIVLADGEGEDPGEAQAADAQTDDGVLRYNVDGNANVARVGFTWSDDDPDPVKHTLSLSQRTKFTEASDEGGGAGSQVTAKLTNEYGRPVSGVTVTFNSNLTNSADDENDGGVGGLEENSRRGSTGSRDGSRRLGYSRDNAAGAIEVITASVAITLDPGRTIQGTTMLNGNCLDSLDDCTETDDDMGDVTATTVWHNILSNGKAETVLGCPTPAEGDPACYGTETIERGADKAAIQYWAADVKDAGSGTIVDRSTDDNRIVFTTVEGCKDRTEADPDADPPVVECTENDDIASLAVYDDNDHFTVAGSPVTMEDFEKALDEMNEDGDAPKYDTVTLANYSDSADNVSAFTISDSTATA